MNPTTRAKLERFKAMERATPPKAPKPFHDYPVGMAALHFVGFRGDEYARAVAVFGPPDFTHRHNDPRFRFGGELGEHDRVVFARYHDADPSPYSYDDSNELDDPAARER